jgi:hypothetical protein
MKGFITDGGCDEEPGHLGSLGHACPTPSRHHTGPSEIDRFHLSLSPSLIPYPVSLLYCPYSLVSSYSSFHLISKYHYRTITD